MFLLSLAACSRNAARGIADRRSNFEKFLPMEQDPTHYGLRPVKPYFTHADRGELQRAFRNACTQGKQASSVFDEATNRGYYVNCDPRNFQLLNGYVPLNPGVQPHSR